MEGLSRHSLGCADSLETQNHSFIAHKHSVWKTTHPLLVIVIVVVVVAVAVLVDEDGLEGEVDDENKAEADDAVKTGGGRYM